MPPQIPPQEPRPIEGLPFDALAPIAKSLQVAEFPRRKIFGENPSA
jgi:hypothetical protein